jgi:hypothetical protein
VPKVFVETGNMRNATDASLLESADFRQREAEALAAGSGSLSLARVGGSGCQRIWAVDKRRAVPERGVGVEHFGSPPPMGVNVSASFWRIVEVDVDRRSGVCRSRLRVSTTRAVDGDVEQHLIGRSWLSELKPAVATNLR